MRHSEKVEVDLYDGAMKNIAFDLETLRTSKEKEANTQYKRSAGISVLVAIDLDTGFPWIYTDRDFGNFGLEKFATLATLSKTLVSYNGMGFDIPVLQHELEREIPVMNHIDLFQCIRREVFPFKPRYQPGDWKLDTVAANTLGHRKLLDDGQYAPQKWAEGRIGEVTTYCWKDAWLTAELYKFVKQHGYVVDPFGHKVKISLLPG